MNLPGLALTETYTVSRAQAAKNSLGERTVTWVPGAQVVQGFDYPVTNQGLYRAGLLNITATREAILQHLELLPESTRLTRASDGQKFLVKNARDWKEAGGLFVQVLLQEVP